MMQKVRVGISSVHGRGVFSICDIAQDELIECCPLITADDVETELLDRTVLKDYIFRMHESRLVTAMFRSKLVVSGMPLGYGSFYNHQRFPNVGHQLILVENPFGADEMLFYALRYIPEGKELFINYTGDHTGQTPHPLD